MKKHLLIAALAFTSGAYLSDIIKETRAVFYHKPKEGFAENPYNLRIVHKETKDGVESYILDTKTGEYKKIKDPKHETLLEKIANYL